jgi:hypothetical protein
MDELRAACAEVARRARSVTIRPDALAAYAAQLGRGAPVAPLPGAPAAQDPPGGRRERAMYWLTLDAINFGSGWFPTLRKRDGLSGSRTIAAAWRARHDADGPLDPTALADLEPAAVAAICGQDPGHELMELYTFSLRDLGAHLLAEFDGDPLALIDGAGGSAVALTRHLGGWACFADASRYRASDPAGHGDSPELLVPFLKRAQILAADLERAGVVAWRDTARLTMFADNLVPHVLRLDGVLEVEPGLVARMERGELIEHGSPEEVELRACAVEAVERIVARLAEMPPASGPVTAAGVDQLLWERGQDPRYKAVPRPRCRCTAY